MEGYEPRMESRRKILTREELGVRLDVVRDRGSCIVFTNGCFDILHAGHVHYLYEAKRAGEVLVVGLNSDASVKRLKGPGRPAVAEQERAEVLAALEMVDLVTIFDEDTPIDLIKAVRPHVLVKGADWDVENVVGREEVEADGGRLLLVPVRSGLSTTEILKRIRSL